MSADEHIGVRLGEASNNNTLNFSTIGGNGQLGILILNTQGDQIYLNDFVNQPVATSDASAAILNSPEKMAYTYGGVERTGYMSNYYSDYKGSDAPALGLEARHLPVATRIHWYSRSPATLTSFL